jgi:hypothetical protein
MVMSASPVFGSFGVLSLVVGVCIVLLFVLRAQRAEVNERVDALTFRLRHPVQDAFAHPLQAIWRRIAR